MDAAIEAFKHGKPVIIMDDDTRENEGDLCLPAAAVTDKDVLFFLRYSTGLLCVACSPFRVDELNLPPMIVDNTDPQKTPFTVSVDLDRKHGTSTGVSAQDKAMTIRALANPKMTGADFSKPGHIFPLRASPQGLYARKGHTEASVELCKIAGVYPACLIAELMNTDGTMSRLTECQRFAAHHAIPLITVRDIQDKIAFISSPLPLVLSDGIDQFKISTYTPPSGDKYVIITKGDVSRQKDVPLRIHSECLTGDVFHSAKCDCGSQLQGFLELLHRSERGVLIYIRGHEGRGIGLEQKIKAYGLQESEGYDTYMANKELHLPLDCRRYDGIIPILQRLEVQSVVLYSENQDKLQCLAPYVSKWQSMPGVVTNYNQRYIKIKREHNGQRSRDFSGADNRKVKIGIAYTTSWHTEHVNHMVKQCREYLASHEIIEQTVSGAFELVRGAQMLFDRGCDSVIVIGILLKGETYHFDAIVSAVSQGVMSLQLVEKKPIVYGVLTCYTQEQIDARVKGDKNTVKEWCQIAIDMIKN